MPRLEGAVHSDLRRRDVLAGDVVGLLDALGLERVGLVGHDWGGAVAWWVAKISPGRLHGLAVLNVPHPFPIPIPIPNGRAGSSSSRH